MPTLTAITCQDTLSDGNEGTTNDAHVDVAVGFAILVAFAIYVLGAYAIGHDLRKL